MYNNKSLYKVRVWDLPTRLFHWALVVCVIGQAITGTIGGNAMLWHFRLGYTVLTLLLFRIIWGLVGGRWSRFRTFIYTPQSVINYLKGQGKPEHSVGHSPIGAGSVFAMLGFLLMQAGSGLFSDDEIAFAGPLTRFVSNATVSLSTSYHKNIGKWMVLALVLLHLLAIIFYLRRKNKLVGAMLHGDKELVIAAPPSRDDTVSRMAALLILAACAVVVYWVSSLAAPAF
ncbi:cytochrome b/b6 domain-containing protein [Polaromonas sp. P1(28)-13]|nr:cytochrome b/b6 domain-containing protein [Polaromonas sp. P1-6]UUZ66664.1 cytochrome b/b6 domain-containing protein [Polaromonas sp. P2-4]UUZ74332.1 cytochrome b/b6 domain-containing protein [Polaromonas sp. P1(28)-13]